MSRYTMSSYNVTASSNTMSSYTTTSNTMSSYTTSSNTMSSYTMPIITMSSYTARSASATPIFRNTPANHSTTCNKVTNTITKKNNTKTTTIRTKNTIVLIRFSISFPVECTVGTVSCPRGRKKPSKNSYSVFAWH